MHFYQCREDLWFDITFEEALDSSHLLDHGREVGILFQQLIHLPHTGSFKQQQTHKPDTWNDAKAEYPKHLYIIALLRESEENSLLKILL